MYHKLIHHLFVSTLIFKVIGGAHSLLRYQIQSCKFGVGKVDTQHIMCQKSQKKKYSNINAIATGPEVLSFKKWCTTDIYSTVTSVSLPERTAIMDIT